MWVTGVCVCMFVCTYMCAVMRGDGVGEACHLHLCMNIHAIDISVSARALKLQITGIQIRTLAKCVCVYVCGRRGRL